VTSVAAVTLLIPEPLQPLMYLKRRGSQVTVCDDGVSTIGHHVGAVGIPLTEVGTILVDNREVGAGWRPRSGSTVVLVPPDRPQTAPTDPPRFLLDIHLGTLTRRLRLLGVDAAWSNDDAESADDALVARAGEEQRVLLTRDRGILLRRSLFAGAYVRGDGPDEQVSDVLERFAPPLAPFTRCPACNGMLAPVAKNEVAEQLEPGTRRTYQEFQQCSACGAVYWAGAHHERLRRFVARHTAGSGTGDGPGDSGAGPGE
jgi:uncharacterized protein with PIN domain